MELDWSSELVVPITFPLILLVVQYVMDRNQPRPRSFQYYVWAGLIGGGTWVVMQTFWYYRRTQSLTLGFLVGGLVWFATSVVVGWVVLKAGERRSRRRRDRRNVR